MSEHLVELFVADEKPLWKLHDPFEAVEQVVDLVYALLVFLYFCLFRYYFPCYGGFNPALDALELELDVFLDDSLVVGVAVLLLHEMGDALAD